MAKFIKNDSGITDTWSGQELTNGQVFELNQDDDYRFQIEASTSGSKVETDVLSGDLKVSLDNFATTLSAADGLGYLKDANAGCIHGVLIDDSAKADGYALKYDSASEKIIYGEVSIATANLACLSLLRTTSLALTTTSAIVPFDTQDIENEPATLERDDTNQERLYLHESAFYFGSVNLQVANNFNQDRSFTLELWRNNTQLLSSNTISIIKSGTEHISRSLIIPPLTPGDYVNLRMKSSNNGDLTLSANCRVVVFQLKGLRGATGSTGANGADGDITWQGAWVSQNYTANQAVKYTNGSSYVCHTNTTSNQVPTDASFWDVLAEKGDTGTAQSRIDISVHPHNDDKKMTASATYISQARFIWGGSTLLGTPLKIYSNSFQATTGTGRVRIYDVTNSLVIAESATISSTSSGNIIDLGTISNISSGQSIWEIQNKGDGNNVNNISSVSLEF